MSLDHTSRVTGSYQHYTRAAVSKLREEFVIDGGKMDLYDTRTEWALRYLVEQRIRQGFDICPFVETLEK